MGHCCLDGYGGQGVVWGDPDTRKATATFLCIRPTTQPIHQGAENARKTRQEESFAKWSTKYLACGMQGCGFDSREEGFAFHVFKLAVMIVHCNMPCCVQSCKMWQIWHEQA